MAISELSLDEAYYLNNLLPGLQSKRVGEKIRDLLLLANKIERAGLVEQMPTQLIRTMICEAEFISGTIASQFPWIGAALTSGTSAQISAVNANHPGIVSVSSAAGASSGYSYFTAISAFGLPKSSIFNASVNIDQTLTPDIRLGYSNTKLAATPTDGVYFAVDAGTPTLIKGRAAKASASVDTVSSFTFVDDTWYTFEILVNEDVSVITFNIYSEAGALLWTDTIATAANIPAVSLGVGIVATRAAGGAGVLAYIDYFGFGAFTLSR